MIWMLGDVDAVAGFYSTSPPHRIEVEDSTLGVLRFANGTLATVVSTTAAVNPSPRTLTIRGTWGRWFLWMRNWPSGTSREVRHPRSRN